GSITLSGSLSGAVQSAPPAPTGVTASNGTFTDGVHVSWTAAPTATSYQVWRATTNSSSKATQIASGVATTAYTDTTATAGTTYYYWVKAVNSAGTSGFSSAASGVRATSSSGPVNDNFISATIISGTSITATGTNAKATKETGEPATIAGNSGGHSVWWAWTAPTSGTATIDTHGSSFDTLLGVYTGSSVSSLTLISANDDDPAGGTTTSKVTFAAVAGTTYYIAVDGYGGVTGNITLHVSLV
ncbi:MAG TPA: PPC domain-containing protein, partial [Tepidisphaeraceae bacterium]|nr:PPC domain-containing protein [Tepidisphaeraceae bacterium]